MAHADIILGGAIEVATRDEVREEVDRGVNDLLGRLPNRHLGNRRRLPASYSVVGAASTGTWVLDFGSPQNDYIWWLVEVVITGKDDREAPASAVSSLYAGSPARQLTNNTIVDTPPLGAIVRPAVAVPSVFTFSKEAFPVKDGENLMAIVYSLTTTMTVISGVATVMEVPASAVVLNRS